MSLKAVKEAAGAHGEDYVSVRADVLAEALKEAGQNPAEKGSLAEHVAQVIDRAKKLARMNGEIDAVYPMISVHREKHLGKLLGVMPQPADLES